MGKGKAGGRHAFMANLDLHLTSWRRNRSDRHRRPKIGLA